MTTRVDSRNLADLIIKPLVTEKATLLMEQNQYVFEVVPKATKPDIKAAIESLFDVKVTSVNTARPPVRKNESVASWALNPKSNARSSPSRKGIRFLCSQTFSFFLV